jgi:enolase-phosphatase E1
MVELQNVKFVLTDIEGTTSDIDFVKKVLFPYSAREMRNFISSNKNNPDVRASLRETGFATDDEAITQLLDWIRDDVKHPALKSLQGKIWEKGFKTNVFKAHAYDDVLPALQGWQAQGLRLGVYSSGSVKAQHLFFEYNEKGNLLPYFESFFDLEVGGKRETKSYAKIATQLGLVASTIVFLSDIVEELDAAREAGLQTVHLLRPGTAEQMRHPVAHAFNEILIRT